MNVMSPSKLEVVPLSPHIGAELRGLDLSRPLSEADVAAINKAWLDHINGKYHNAALGMSMRVEKSSKDEVKEKLEALAREKELRKALCRTAKCTSAAEVGLVVDENLATTRLDEMVLRND